LRRRLCEAVYESLSTYLLMSARRRLPRQLKDELEDVAHAVLYHTFRKAIRLCEGQKLNVFASDETLAAYFRKVGTNELRDQITALSQERARVSVPLGEEPAVESAQDEPAMAEDVQAALALLKELDRRIVQLRSRGLEYEEIRHELKLRQSAGALRTRYSRALNFLRKALRRSSSAG